MNQNSASIPSVEAAAALVRHAASVSIGPFVSETDEAEREREKQETRRLLYVAMTRARDRLYLSSSLKDGVLAPGRGSLAEVLPDSLKRLFEHAATSFPEVAVAAWTGQSGRAFDLRICRTPTLVSDAAATGIPGQTAEGERPNAFGSVDLHRAAPARVGVMDWLVSDGGQEAVPGGVGGDVTAGILVHRLVESRGLALTTDDEADLTYARDLLRPEERASLEDIDATVRAAVASWRGLQNRPEISRLLTTGRRHHEVPFSLRTELNGAPVVLRGSIDCLVQQENGAIVVVELKTGKRRPVHQRQLDVYVEAARRLFPRAVVEGRLVYSD